MKRALVVWLILVSAAVALAQPAAPADRREKVKQKIRALRAYTLTEQLELDEATAAKLFPALAKYDDEFDKLLQARADLQRRLDDAGSLKDPKAIDKLVDDAVANQRALWDTETRRLDQLRKILTPAQVARTLVVLPAMERKIQNQLRRAVQKKAGRPPGPERDDEVLRNPYADDTRGTVDPFDKTGGVDPFGGRAPVDPYEPPKPRAKAKRGGGGSDANVPCDPFGSRHGCKP